MVTELQIKEQYETFMSLIEGDSRKETLSTMYTDFGMRLIEAPASGKTYYHNCFPGGYLDHVLRVCDAAGRVAVTLKNLGGRIDFTKQEMIFAALHHDLGKLGDLTNPYYVDQESDWHRKRGEYYKINDVLQYMTVTDRAMYILQHYGVTITEKEWLAIKLSDGMYDESNKPYLKNSMYPYPMHTNLAYIIHTADFLSTAVERDQSRISLEE